MCVEIKFQITKKNVTTFFCKDWRLLTVPKDQCSEFQFDDAKDSEWKLTFRVSEALLEKFQATPSAHHILSNLAERCGGERDPETVRLINKRHTTLYTSGKEEKSSIMQVKLSPFLAECMLPLFFSSYVNFEPILRAEKGKKRDAAKAAFENRIAGFQTESFTFTFDLTKSTVTLTDVDLFEPKTPDPYLEYARAAAGMTSVEAVLPYQSGEKASDGKPQGFYDVSQMSPWRERSLLNKEKKEKSDLPGIYMLYDQKNNQFYVGVGTKVLTRIEQHGSQQNESEPIPNWTHYRYTPVREQYYLMLYLIESAAIHDCAWIFSTPNLNVKCSPR